MLDVTGPAELEAPPGSSMKDEETFTGLSIEDLLNDKRWEAKVFGLKQMRGNPERCTPEAITLAMRLVSDKSVPVQKECLETVHWCCKIVDQAEFAVPGSEEGFVAVSVTAEQLSSSLEVWWAECCCPAILNAGLLNQPRTKTQFLDFLEDLLYLIGDRKILDEPLAGVLLSQHIVGGKPNAKSLKGPAIKTVANVIAIFDRALIDYGSSVFDVKLISQISSGLITHTDRTLREALYGLAVSIYRVCKSIDPLTATLQDQKPIITELTKRCEPFLNDPALAPKRIYRSRRTQVSNSELTAPEGAALGMSDSCQVLDGQAFGEHSWEALEGIDLLGSQFNAESFDRRVKGIEKWNERKACLEDFVEPLAKFAVPKLIITPGVTMSNLRSVLLTLNYLVDHDKNVSVQTAAVKVSTILCRSVRAELTAHLLDTARVLVKSFVAKLKDKAKPLQIACLEGMTALFTECVCIDQFADEISAGIIQKNPQERLLVLQWLGTMMASCAADVMAKCLKKFLAAAIDCANDSNEAIRVASGIVILEATHFNEKLVAHAIDQVKDSKRRTTIQEVLARAGKVITQSPTRGSNSPAGATESLKREQGFGASATHSVAPLPIMQSVTQRLESRQESRHDSRYDAHEGSSIHHPNPPPHRTKPVVNPTWSYASAAGDHHGFPSAVSATADLRNSVKDLAHVDWKMRKNCVQKVGDLLKSRGITESDTDVLHELALQLKTAYKAESQRNVLLPLIELGGSLSKIFKNGGDCLHHCALQLLPALISRYNVEKNQTVLTCLKGALRDWIQLLGVLDFSYYAGGGDNSPPTTNIDLPIDKLEAYYTLIEAYVRQHGAVRSERLAQRHPELEESDHTLNFVAQMLNDLENNERSTVLNRVCYNVLSFVEGAEPDFWAYLADMAERGAAPLNILEFIQSKSAEEAARRETDDRKLILLDAPEGESMSRRLQRARVWTSRSPENLRALAEDWRPHVTELLHCSMFPELTCADVDVASAINFWMATVYFSSNCTSLESRLGNLPQFVRIFDDEQGIVDLLFEWLVMRICDTNASLIMRSTTARILQDTLARLIAARYDIRSLAEQGIDVPAETARVEGTLSNNLIEKLFETFLELLRLRPPDQDAEVYSIIQDVWLALTFVARDTSFLYAITLVKRKRHPEVLELTAFILEQEGWVACCNLMAELTDFARFALSDQHDSTIRDLASQCLVLILLSLSRQSASKAIKQLEEEVPGTKKFVSRYTRSHQGLLNIFPRGGVIPQDHRCFAEKCMSVEQYLASQSATAPAGSASNSAALVQPKGAGGPRDATSSTTHEEPLANRVQGVVSEFDDLLAKCDIDNNLENVRTELESKTWLLKKQLASMRLLDWYQDLRREREGKRVGLESELTYWNGTRLLEYVQKSAHTDSSYIILEAKRLLQSDMSQLREASTVLLGIHAQNSHTNSKLAANSATGEAEEGDWMVPFSVDLICGCYTALRTVFQLEKFGQRDFMATAEQVTELTFEVCRSRKVLYQASPGLLCSMFSAALICMGQHKYWDDLPGSKNVVEKLNAIMGIHLLGRVSPRTASCVLECFYEYAIPMNRTLADICSYDCTIPPHIDADLFLRVSRRFVRKLNIKHPQVTELEPDSLYPLTANDRLNYMRILDSALSCLLLTEICIPQPSQHEDLRFSLLQCVKELFASLLIYTPALVSIYLRDKGYKSCLAELNERLNQLLGQAPGDMGSSSIACLYIEPQMSRSKFLSYCLEKLMNEDALDREAASYLYLHKAYLANNQSSKLTLPDRGYPHFCIDELVERAPAAVSLMTLDSTTANGWGKKRDIFYTVEDAKKRTDVVPLEQLQVSWVKRLGRFCNGGVTAGGAGSVGGSPSKCGSEKLTLLSMRFRSFC